MKKNFFLWFIVAFLVVYIFTSPPSNQDALKNETVSLITNSQEVRQGSAPQLTITNNSAEVLTIANDCPNEPLAVYRYVDGQWSQIEATASHITCSSTEPITLAQGESYTVDYAPWKAALFSHFSRYQVRADITDSQGNSKEYVSNEFSIVQPSLLVNMWRQLLYRPFYNLLIALTLYLPGHSLGLAIILLTLIIRFALLAPSQKAMKAQRKMQAIQPKLQHIREKYKNDQQRLAQETMRIWRENKVNPMGSCLPMLIQFPVLIALFYVVQEGLDPNNVFLLYSALKGVDLNAIHTNFLGLLDLTKPNLYVLPLIVGFLQFAQMKYSMSFKKDTQPKKKDIKPGEPDLAAVSNMMIYVMPVMIAVFTASLPAGVGLYWAISTLFGVGQQYFVNRQPLEESNNSDGVTVRVVE